MRGAEKIQFPNDREPSNEELEMTEPNDAWYKEKGPFFAACHILYNDITKKDVGSPTSATQVLSNYFADLDPSQAYNYCSKAERWCRQKIQKSPAGELAPI